MMKNFSYIIITLYIINACICEGKTECVNKARISIIADLDSEECIEKISNDKVPEEDNIVAQKNNFSYDGFHVEVAAFKICNPDSDILKAVFKSMAWGDVNCLQPPYFLGFIGPNTKEDLSAALKITAALKIPHITSISTILPYTHSLDTSEYQMISRGLLTVLKYFKWKSFIFINDAKSYKTKHIAKLLAEEAVANNFCLMTSKDVSPFIIYIGEPDENFLYKLKNSFMIIINENNHSDRIKNINSTNSFLFVNVKFNENMMSSELDKVKYWDENLNKLDVLKNDFIQKAVIIYLKALQLLCKNRNCVIDKDTEEWNNFIKQAFKFVENTMLEHVLPFSIKEDNKDVKGIGKIIIDNKDVSIRWNDQVIILNKKSSNGHTNAVKILKSFINDNNSEVECSTNIKATKKDKNDDKFHKYKSNTIIISDISDSEWWTMVTTVAGFGVAMFTIGFFAVYVVYTNVRGPRNEKETVHRNFNRDSSLRRVGSDRQAPNSSNKPHRVVKNLQRRDSRSSIRSNISEKSV